MSKEPTSTGENDKVLAWQKKLLPWFILMPTILVGTFIYMASMQVTKFNQALEIRQDTVLLGQYLPIPDKTFDFNQIKDQEKYLRWITLTRMEQESYYRRYHQAGQILMARIYVKYLGFFTGMILAIVGAVFIIGKIREESSKLEGTAKELIKFNIVSSSPGIIFAFLGSILMIVTIMTNHRIDMEDSPLYLNHRTITAMDLLDLKGSKKQSGATTAQDTTAIDTALVNKHLQMWGQ